MLSAGPHAWLSTAGPNDPIGFMPWNTVLAVAPALFSLMLLRRSDQSSHRFSGIVYALRFGLVLHFYPNAP